MRAFVVPSVFLVGFVISSAACATADEPSAPETATVTQPVIGGTIDTAAANNAVVQLESSGGRCTGTIFKKTADATWILTAAHCVPTSRVIVGPDSDVPLRTYQVAETVADERYGDGEGRFSLDYDIAVVKVDSVITEATEIELAGTTDSLAVGTPVTSLGYGNTRGYRTNDDNTQRRSIDRPIETLSAGALTYDQSDQRGICAGDSGGPVLFGSGADRRVVGVHSTVGNVEGQEKCFGQANSIRVSARHDFVDAAVAGTALPQLGACESCIVTSDDNATCRQKEQRCQSDTACAALTRCLEGGGGGACLDEYPAGLGPYLDVFECGCSDACATQCSGQTVCADVSKCGLAFTGADYNSCIEANCCAEADAAAADGIAYQCAGFPSGPGCAANAAYKAFATCAKDKCNPKSSSSSSSSSGAVEEEEPEEEVPAEEEPSTTKKSKKDEGGCSVSNAGTPASGGSPAGLLLAVCAGMALGARGARRARR